MTRGLLLSFYRVAFALLALAAIVVQLVDLAGKGTLDVVNYFSYFTIETNLIGVAAFFLARDFRERRPHWVDLVRGASTVYLLITFLVFAVLLSGTDVDTAIPWVDFVLHKIFPIAVLVDWLIDPPARLITPRQAATWLLYPVIWVAYALIRGALTGRYPYPFLDPANGGYGTVALYIVGVLVLAILLIVGVIAVGRWLGRNRSADVASGTT
ncbi:MAG: Pr6Pr family membrane protein [Candidatus Limnocylindrales bacterium]